MSDSNREENELEKQMKDIDELKNNAANPGCFAGPEKIPAPVRGLRKYPVILIVVGVLGLVFSAIFLIKSYRSTNKIEELIFPIMYNFIPFFVSFLLFKIGINEFANRKKK
ncbi:hypothetical protein NBE98_15750 [Clostridium swellfunianum]|uniref:hypothetical protein n=1 Tax=Clostridium swellfunianum TaxID=1367462 RepID=UPI00202F505C|nr:hypothetical protein [Clostridium swellfunianum]MCM0649820.1 hypothetical protein [Clostridium swellfunianum]